MVKSISAVVLFIFMTSIAFAENANVLVSKENTQAPKEMQKTANVAGVQKQADVLESKFVEEEKAKSEVKAKEEAKEEEEMAEKKTKGLVMGVSPQGFAVQYAAEKGTGKEIWFNFDENMELVKLQSKSELQEGDTVSVVYGEAADHRKLVKKIELIQRKPEEKKPAEDQTSEQKEL